MLIKKESLKPFTTELPADCSQIIKEMLADSSGPELFCHRLDTLSELCGQTGKVEFSQFWELVKLLDTIKPKILTHTLRLLISISKTSRYIMQHVTVEDQKQLSTKLMAIYECWDKCDSNSLTELIKSDELSKNAKIAPKVSNEMSQPFDSSTLTLQQANALLYNHLNGMEEDGEEFDRITPLVQLRFNYYMDNLETRIDSVIHCLMSMSVASYSRCLLDDWQMTSVVKDIMIEEICELVQLEASSFDDTMATLIDSLRTESLKTLASIVFLDKREKLQLVVDNLGLNSYLGYAANVMRNVVRKLKTDEATTESTSFITALFSLIYHIAGFEIGGASLVSISTVPTLLDVVSLTTLPDSLISFATRAVRIIDILTSISFQEFNSHDGIQIVVKRLVYEVGKCREFVEQNQQPADRLFVCHHHRAALIKSLLNFLKRSVVDSIYVNHSRRIMDGDLPKALVHIFETPRYYGSSLVHCALELTTVFIYQEPAQLSTIQDCGVSLAIIKLFSSNHFPISREIVLSLPNISSAMCLNERGLTIFNEQKPLVQIFRIIFSTAFIQVLRKRKTELISAGGQLGIHFDEFMRHQPTLRRELIVAFVTILDEIIDKANDPEINVSAKPTHGNKTADVVTPSGSNSKPDSDSSARTRTSISIHSFTQYINGWNSFSDEKLQGLKEEVEKNRRTHLVAEASTEKKSNFELVQDGNYMPLSDYMVLAIKMIEAILSNSTVADNSTAMTESKLIEKLLSFFSSERIMPIVSNPNYLHSLPSVFRLLLQQSRSSQTFVVIGRIIKEQLTNFKLPEDIAELTTQSKVTELNRLSSLVSVFLSFLRMSLTPNAQDSKTLIFQYLSTTPDGLKFIGEILTVLQKFGKCIAHFNKDFRDSVLINSRKNTVSQPAPQISVEITTTTSSSNVTSNVTSNEHASDTTSNEHAMDTSTIAPTIKEDTTPSISAPYSLMSSIYKNLIEVVCQFGRSINSTRTRRIPDGIQTTDNTKIAKELLLGVHRVLDTVDYNDNWTFYIQNSLPMVRRLICDENSNPYPLMLSYFVETRCHALFFDIGEKLLNEKDITTISAPLLYWLETLTSLLNVENITNLRLRADRPLNRDSFVMEDYLKLVQGDAVSVVGKIFERLLDTHVGSQPTKEDSTTIDSSQLLDKVLEIFKELFRGIFYLHNKNKKPTVPIALLPPSEVDAGNVELLMDMGFSNDQAIQALSLYSSVDEAAEHLLSIGAMQAQSSAENVSGQSEQAEEVAENDPEAIQEPNFGDAAPSEAMLEVPIVEKQKKIQRKAFDFEQSVFYLRDELVPKCLHLMEKEPSIVYSVAEMLRVFIYDPEIKEWAETMLIKNIFVKELNSTLSELASNFESVEELKIKQFASQIHLICLLWSGFDDVYINSLDECDFYKNVVNVVSQIINTGKHVTTLLAPLVLWLDLYKKHYCLAKRRSLFNESVEDSINWFYWLQDDQHYGSTSVIRRDFTPLCSSEITTAFKAGKYECKLKISDKHYIIDFSTMTQKQADRSTSTPIYASVKLKKDFDIDAFIKAEKELQASDEDSIKLVELVMKMLKLSVSNAEYQSELVFSLVSLIHRLTLDETAAKKFIELEGIETLVRLQCNKPTTLLSTVVTLTLRNCSINPEMAAYAINRIFQALNAGSPISLSEQNNASMSSKYHRSMKECRRFLRLLTPFCDQNIQPYVNVIREVATHKDFGELQMKNPSASTDLLDITQSDLSNVEKVFVVVTNELFQFIDNKTTCTERILQPSNLLLIIAELIRSYPKASTPILALKHNERSFLQLLLENIILDGKQSTEMIVAANAVFFSIINGHPNTECNDQIVQIIQDSLKSVIESVANKEAELSKEEGKEFCQKLTTLAKFVSMLKESNSTAPSPRDTSKKTFVHVVHDKNLLLEFVKAIRLVPLDNQSAAETTNTMFRFLEDFCRVIGVTKADVAAREFAINHPGQSTTSTSQPDESVTTQQSDQSTSAQSDQQIPPQENVVNRVEINDGNQQVLLEVVEAPDELDEDIDHEDVDHIEFNDFQPIEMEDDFDETAEMMFNDNNQLPPRSNSSSSSDDSNEVDRVEAMDQQAAEQDQQQHALNQLNESVATAEAANSNIVRNLEQLNNGLNEIDISLRRHQNAIRTIMQEESEEEPNDGARESDDDDIEIAEDSTDEEMEETEEDDTAEQDEAQNSAQNDAEFAMRNAFDLAIEMLPNVSVSGRARTGGLLQIRNGQANEAIVFPGAGVDLASQLSLLSEYLTGYYSASRRNPRSNIVLNTLRGGNGESFRNRILPSSVTAGLPSAVARTENYHPLLRRPSRFGPLSTNPQAPQGLVTIDREFSNFIVADGAMDGSPLDPGSNVIENVISSIVSARHRGHRSAHSSRHHRGLHRQNALRSRPFFTTGRDFTHPRLITFNAPTRGQMRNTSYFEDEQQLMNALQDPCYQSFNRRTVDSFVPFMLDRVATSTRLVNANSVQYIGLVVSAYLSEVCRQRVEPPPAITRQPVVTEQPQLIEPVQNAMQDAVVNERPNEDEAQSIDSVSVDSSELTNRFENLAQNIEDEETRDSRNEDLDEGERTPVNMPEGETQPQQMETDPIIQPVTDEHASSFVTGNFDLIEFGASPDGETTEQVEPSEQAGSNVENSQQPVESSDQPAESSEQPAEAVVEDQPGPSNEQQEEDDGLDPEFLAALPDDIREEVIRDHQRQQRLNQLQRRQRQQSSTVVENATDATANETPAENQPQIEELDQEFLAALPPELQEEVLAQHLAQQNARNNPNADNAPADTIAFLDSLNPTLRAQVLADADESIIQTLPQGLAAEANRIRRDYEHEQLIRLADMRTEQRNYAWRTTEPPFGENYTTAATPASIVQILDQEAISTLALFYFFNNEKFTIARFQRVFKVVSMHPGTCDFVLRSLLSILKAACIEDSNGEEKELDSSRWGHSFKMQSSSNTAEKILFINKDNKIVVNKQFRTQVVSRVLDTLNLLARQSAAHFFNSSLRFHASKEVPTVEKPEGLSQFWKLVEKFDSNYKTVNVVTELEPIVEVSDENIRNCPFGLLLDLSSKSPIAGSSQFLEKVLRVFHSVLHIPATVTYTKKEIPLASTDETTEFLLNKLRKLITAVIDANSGDDSFRDFRNFLVQLLYAFPSLRHSIFVILYDIVKNQGMKLTVLLTQLRGSFEEEDSTPMSDSNIPGTSTGPEHAPQKEFPSLKVLSSKRNSLKKLLNTLTVISFIRQQLADLYIRRRRPGDEPGNKYFTQEDAEKEDKLLHGVLDDLNDLWDILSYCLDKISDSKDNRALMGLQSAAEAFFLLHSLAISNPATAQLQPVVVVPVIEQPSTEQVVEQPSTEQVVEQPSTDQPIEQPSTDQPIEQPQVEQVAVIPTTEHTTTPKKLDDPKLSRFTEKILEFAGKHRTVLNQILRGNNSTMEMLAVLSQFPKLLDFDVKRKYFNREIKKLENRSRMHHDDVVVRIRRSHLFSDAYRELFRLRPAEWKSRFYIIFEGEEGQDAGGLLREFYSTITREIFNPNYALFITSPGDNVTFMVNKASYINIEHLDYFKFAGHIIAKAIYDQKQLDCYFTRAFYKQILNLPVNYTDIESFDVEYYKNLMFLLENPIESAGVELNFNLEVEEFGVRSWRELKENGNNIAVTDENKEEYVRLVCREKLTGAVQKQLDAFLVGFYEIIPRQLISIFNEQELELLISGLPEIDIDDLAANTEYKQYTKTSPQIQWLWRTLRSFEKEDLAKFLQFVLGSSKVPLNGFSELQGMNGTQKFTVQKDTRSTERLPAAHTCFNQLDLPVYESYEKLREYLLKAIRECASFGFA